MRLWIVIVLLLYVSCDRIYAPKYVKPENLTRHQTIQGYFNDEYVFTEVTSTGVRYIILLSDRVTGGYISAASNVDIIACCGGDWNELRTRMNYGRTEMYVYTRDVLGEWCKYSITIIEAFGATDALF